MNDNVRRLGIDHRVVGIPVREQVTMILAHSDRFHVVTCSRHTGDHLLQEDCVQIVKVGRLIGGMR